MIMSEGIALGSGGYSGPRRKILLDVGNDVRNIGEGRHGCKPARSSHEEVGVPEQRELVRKTEAGDARDGDVGSPRQRAVPFVKAAQHQELHAGVARADLINE